MRRYMLAYLGLENIRSQNGIDLQQEMSCALVERIITRHKQRKKSHRNVADQEVKFIEEVVSWMKTAVNATVV